MLAQDNERFISDSSKEFGLVVNADNWVYIRVSSPGYKTKSLYNVYNKSLGNMTKLRYFGTTVKNNFIQEENQVAAMQYRIFYLLHLCYALDRKEAVPPPVRCVRPWVNHSVAGHFPSWLQPPKQIIGDDEIGCIIQDFNMTVFWDVKQSHCCGLDKWGFDSEQSPSDWFRFRLGPTVS